MVHQVPRIDLNGDSADHPAAFVDCLGGQYSIGELSQEDMRTTPTLGFWERGTYNRSNYARGFVRCNSEFSGPIEPPSIKTGSGAISSLFRVVAVQSGSGGFNVSSIAFE